MEETERNVCITFTETTEYSLELEFAEMAKVMGVSKKKLTVMLDDGEDYEPSDSAVRRLRKQADVQSEEVTVDDIFES